MDNAILIGAYRMVRDLDRETARISAEFGLTYPQFQVLEALLHKGELSVGQIRDAILSSDGTVPVVVDNLCRKGLVRRTKDPRDRRRSLVSLTDVGASLIREAYPRNEEMIEAKFDIWTAEDKRELCYLLGIYHASLKGEAKEMGGEGKC